MSEPEAPGNGPGWPERPSWGFAGAMLLLMALAIVAVYLSNLYELAAIRARSAPAAAQGPEAPR